MRNYELEKVRGIDPLTKFRLHKLHLNVEEKEYYNNRDTILSKTTQKIAQNKAPYKSTEK